MKHMMEFTAEMIAGFLGGDIVGNKDAKVHTVSSIEEGRAGSLAYLTNPKYEPFLYTTGASIVLVDRAFEPSQPVAATLVKVDDAGACVLKLLEMYNAAKPRRKRISGRASVSERAQVGQECYINDFAVVEEDAVIETLTDENGIAQTEVAPGNYTISVFGESESEGNTYYLNGSVQNKAITKDITPEQAEASNDFSIAIRPAMVGPLCFSQIFYCGSTPLNE